MRKLIRASLLTLALTTSTYAGEMGQPFLTPPPSNATGEMGQPTPTPPPDGATASGDMQNGIIRTVLTILTVTLSLT
jgi:hypothetical protein